jgi:hypothetical protein
MAGDSRAARLAVAMRGVAIVIARILSIPGILRDEIRE